MRMAMLDVLACVWGDASPQYLQNLLLGLTDDADEGVMDMSGPTVTTIARGGEQGAAIAMGRVRDRGGARSKGPPMARRRVWWRADGDVGRTGDGTRAGSWP